MPQMTFLTFGGRAVASTRLRVLQFLPLLEEAGYQVEVYPPARSSRGVARITERRREEKELLRAVAGTDIVFVQKRLFRSKFFARLREVGGRVVFDFDDAVYGGRHPRLSPTRARAALRFTAAVRAADLVIAGNSWLAASAHAPEKTVVLPTAVDLARYRLPPPSSSGGEVVVGWIGSSVNFRYLADVVPVLRRLRSEGVPLRLVVIADRPFRAGGVEIVNRRWSEISEVRDILEMDMGIMPLATDDWTRGKCAYKALQYMACGIPAVCTDFGAARDIIESGRNGFLCRTQEEWGQVLRMLAADPGLRERIGREGRRTVEEYFSRDVVGRRLVRLLDDLTAGRGGQGSGGP